MLGDLASVRIPDTIDPTIGWRSWEAKWSFGDRALLSADIAQIRPGTCRPARVDPYYALHVVKECRHGASVVLTLDKS